MVCKCCFNCEKREVGCHSTCKDYIDYKKANSLELKELHKNNEEIYFKICSVTNTKKKYCH